MEANVEYSENMLTKIQILVYLVPGRHWLKQRRTSEESPKQGLIGPAGFTADLKTENWTLQPDHSL